MKPFYIIFLVLMVGEPVLFLPDHMSDHTRIKENLYKDVDFLTSIQPARNHANIASLNKAADYIYTTLNSLTPRVEYQSFRVNGKEYKNIIASFGPKDGPRTIVGAHYDVAGDQQGADDNASAVAGLLQIGRMLASNQQKLNNRVDLVAYSLEEPPYFATDSMGSAVHATFLKKNNIPVKMMLCLEMIGYFSEEQGSQSFPDPALARIYPNRGNFLVVVGKTGQEGITAKVKALMLSNSNIDVQSINLPSEEYLAGLSDHRNYWKMGYDAVMINDTSFLRNPNYHKKSDTIDTLDFDKMVEVIKGVYGTILHL